MRGSGVATAIHSRGKSQYEERKKGNADISFYKARNTRYSCEDKHGLARSDIWSFISGFRHSQVALYGTVQQALRSCK